MTLEELIQEVTRQGLRINNLFQLDNGRWQANVTDGTKYWEFGRGDTAIAALEAALHISSTEDYGYGIEKPIRTQMDERRTRVVDHRPATRIAPADVPFLDI